jgi:hypothetical protein
MSDGYDALVVRGDIVAPPNIASCQKLLQKDRGLPADNVEP